MSSYIRLFLASLLAGASLGAQTDYTFSDAGRSVAYRMAADEVFSRAGRGVRSTAVSQEWGGGRILKLGGGESSRKLVKSNWAQDRKALAPVFYYSGDLPTAEKLAALPADAREKRLANARRVMTEKLLVHLEKSQSERLAATQPLGFEESLVAGWLLVSYADAFTALDAVDWMTRQGGFEFGPVFSRTMGKRQTLSRAVNDPLYPRQWHLQSTTAFNLSMRNVWDSVTGKNINMTIVDDGLEMKHEDLAANVLPLGLGNHANFNDGDPSDPSPTDPKQNHGTNCAGIAGATGFNSLGVIGVAPEARLMGLRLIAGDAAEDANGRAMAWQPAGLITHVSSNSWGPADDGASDGRISSLQLAGIEKGALENRNGLGTVFVISAGNGRDNGDDQSYDGFSSSRYGIAVAAVNRTGNQSSYSESGMGVAISAFGGEFQQPDVTWTTNNMGAAAFGIKQESFPTSEAPINYTDSFNGTSAAAPQVSGAAALMLERNPRLGYRDVKEILMRTGNRAGLKGKDEFVKNGGDFTLSHSFGAGLVNVAAAVDLAGRWTNLGPMITSEIEATGTQEISDNGTLSTLDFDFTPAKIRAEHIEITFTIKHASRGDLEFGILSPFGTLSTANSRPKDDNADFTDYTMTSVMHWGESASGKWKVLFLDGKKNGKGGSIIKAKLKVYGTAQ